MPLSYLGKAKGFGSRTYTEVWPSKFLPEFGETGKWRSPLSQRLIKEDLDEFSSPSVVRPKSDLFDIAVHRVSEMFRLPQPEALIHLNDVFKLDLGIWNKSPGLPWTMHGYKTKGDIRDDPEAVRKVRKFAHFIKNGKEMQSPDCLAYGRAHICDVGETKVRAVCGYPATLSFCEAMFAVPLIDAYKKFSSRLTPIAYGLEIAIGGARSIFHRFNGDKCFAGLDFKKFDKTVPAWLIEIAFDILMLNLNLGAYRDYGVADVRKSALLFYYLRDYFINTKIRLADGRRFQKSSGIASGSYFTQLIGSIVNAILIVWMSLEMHGSFPDDLLVLGDDSLLSSARLWSLEHAQSLLDQIGMRLNFDKSQVRSSLDIKFLGYNINHGIPRKPRSDWIAALVYPERPDTSMDEVQSRALGLYYANMCVDEEFARITRTIVKFRPFDLMMSRNMERMLTHIGVCLKDVDPYNLPTPLDFARLMVA